MWLQTFFKALGEEYRREFMSSSFTDDNFKLAIEKHGSDVINFLRSRFDVFDIIVLVFFLGFLLGVLS